MTVDGGCSVGFAEKKKEIFAFGKNRFFLFRKSNINNIATRHPGRIFSVIKEVRLLYDFL